MKSLKVENVEKSFGSVKVLRGVSLDIQAGQFLILVGPSGCGKSTLLNMIAGLEPVSGGRIKIGERDVTHLPPKDRDIAMVFQSYALYPNMTIRKNISFGMEMRKVSKDKREENVNRIAKILKIEPLLDRKPAELSGGQRQRVAMGRALARSPALFLFDEPLSNLDAKLRVEMRAEIKELHRRTQATITYVTHDQIEAMTLGDVIAVMKDGIVQQYGSPKEVYNNPVNLFVAGFMGSPSMNFVPCEIVQTDQGYAAAVDNNGQQLLLPVSPAVQTIANYVERQVILGIRPEQISDMAQRAQHLAVDCKIENIEPTGPDTIVAFYLNGKKVIGRVHPEVLCEPGMLLSLHFDLSKVVYFDPDSEMRIA